MTANTATGRTRHNPIVSVRSLTAALASAIVGAMIGTICVARMASAEEAPLALSDVQGRWVSQRTKLTLDVSRCGDDFCGVVVADNACGHTALRISDRGMDRDSARRLSGRPVLEGQLQLAAGSQPYGVQVTLSRDEAGVARLFIAGHSGGTFSVMRRSYDYNDLMVRAGDASCAPALKTS